MARSWRTVSVYLKRHLDRRWHLMLVGVASLILLIDFLKPIWLYSFREWGIASTSPIQWVVSGAREDILDSITWFERTQNQSAQIALLQEENTLLRQWHQLALSFQKKNQYLEQYFSSNKISNSMPMQHFILSRNQTELANHQVYFEIPKNIELKLYSAVINEKGIVGRIVSLEDSQAKIMLLSHMKSRIPIQIGNMKQKAILVGRGKSVAVLEYAQYTAEPNIRVGDVIKSSGFVGLLPEGLRVGTVSKIVQGRVYVQLSFIPHKLRYVGVINSELTLQRTGQALPLESAESTDVDEKIEDSEMRKDS